MISAAAPDDASFLGLLEPAERAAIRDLGRTRRFPRGSVLMYEGEPGERVMVLVTGRVKITGLTEDGRELLFGICDPDDILGELSFIDGRARATSVIALEPVEAVVISSSVFRRHLETSPRVTLALLEALTRRFRDTTLKRAQFASSDTTGRLAARLVELSERYGAPTEFGVEIALALSQEELAGWTGASRAGLAKAVQLLRELDWIETGRRRILVRDLDALRARAA